MGNYGGDSDDYALSIGSYDNGLNLHFEEENKRFTNSDHSFVR